MSRYSEPKTKFREYCMENGLTAKDVADVLEVSKNTVDSYFQGRRLPSRRTRQKMEDRLGIDTRRMFGL